MPLKIDWHSHTFTECKHNVQILTSCRAKHANISVLKNKMGWFFQSPKVYCSPVHKLQWVPKWQSHLHEWALNVQCCGWVRKNIQLMHWFIYCSHQAIVAVFSYNNGSILNSAVSVAFLICYQSWLTSSNPGKICVYSLNNINFVANTIDALLSSHATWSYAEPWKVSVHKSSPKCPCSWHGITLLQCQNATY